MRYKAPCKDCENRHFGCHSECKTYLDYAKQVEDSRKEIHRMKVKEMMIYNSTVEGGKRMKNKRATNKFRK